MDEVLADGSVRIVAYVPNPAVSDATPTCIASGRDHTLYVGTLAFGANFAFGQGGKNPQSIVYRFDPNASSSVQMLSEADVWAKGFFPITGCGFGADGFYVTEFWTSLAPPGGGDVVRISINGDGSAGARTHLGVGLLKQPNGFAASPDGTIYVSNNSTSANGSVVRIKPYGRERFFLKRPRPSRDGLGDMAPPEGTQATYLVFQTFGVRKRFDRPQLFCAPVMEWTN